MLLFIYPPFLPIQVLLGEGVHEARGWKLTHVDVFRPPQHRPMLLSVFIATGLQLFFISLVAFILGFTKISSPIPFEHKGTILRHGTMLTAVILTYILTGCIAGYCKYVYFTATVAQMTGIMFLRITDFLFCFIL